MAYYGCNDNRALNNQKNPTTDQDFQTCGGGNPDSTGLCGLFLYYDAHNQMGLECDGDCSVNTGTYILSSSLDAIEVSSSVARTEDTANYWGDRIGWVIDVEPSDHYFVGEVLVHDNI